MKKFLIVSGIGAVLLVAAIALYYRSQRRVQKGVEYDLSQAGEIFNITGQTAPKDSTGARIPVDSRVEPAASLIARQMDAFYKSENTMSEIRQRIGYNSNLFKGMNATATQKIKTAFKNKFDINENSLLSYPTWDKSKDINLFLQLDAKAKNPPTRLGSSAVQTWAFVTPWGMHFDQIGLNLTQPADVGQVAIFFKNAASEIQRLDDQVRYEAVKYLQKLGWKFSDYGDVL